MDVMDSCSLSLDDETELKRFSDLGPVFVDTLSRAAVDFLESIDVPAYKIGSGEWVI